MDKIRLKHLERFYAILTNLERLTGGARKLSACNGRMLWPERGIYFFRENGEHRAETGEGPRIVRVGTHALKAASGTKLWTRLSQHKGEAGSRGGNHRGSIFRLLVGGALIRREGLNLTTWGCGNTADRKVRDDEVLLEQRVSREIGAMSCLWLPIEDAPGPDSLRGVIERNSIALLSNMNKAAIDPPSEDWLGHHSDRVRVRGSGLWNQNHVEETYSPDFLDLFERLVSKAGGRSL